MEEVDQIEITSEDVTKFCGICELDDTTTTASVYCKTCKQFLCDLCNKQHKRFAAMSDHTVVDVEGEEAGKVEIDMRGIDRCRKHGKKLRYYCKADDELCCSACAIDSHLKCDGIGDIETFASENNEKLTEQITSELQRQKNTSAVLIATIPNLLEKMHRNQADKLQEIDTTKENLVSMFNSFQTQFKEETDKEIACVDKALNKELATCKLLENKRHDMGMFVDKVMKEGTARQTFVAINVYSKQVAQLGKSFETVESKMSTLDFDVTLDDCIHGHREKSTSVGKWSTKKIVVVKPLVVNVDVLMELKKSRKDRHDPLFSGLDFLQDGRIIVVDNLNSTCTVLDDRLKILCRSVLENKPLGLAVLSRSMVVISHGKTISVYSVNDDPTVKHLKTFPTKAHIYSLAALDEDTLVAGTFKCPVPAKLVTISTETETEFDLPFTPVQYKFDKSRVIYIPSLRILVHTASDENKCYLWNVESKTKTVVEDERIKAPTGVCATSYGLIFVCSSETNSILQISPTGRILGSIPIQNKWPDTIAVSSDDKQLLVYNSENGQRRLKLFKIT